MASMDRAIRVYEAVKSGSQPLCYEGALVQQHHGHSDAVRCVIHVPEKQQYITASWDHTIRVWKAYTGPEKGGGGAARVGGAAAAEGAAVDVGSNTVEEPVELTYAERFPLREPKMLGKAQGQGQFLKKASTEETREKKKKKQAEDEMAAKAVNGLSLKLAELEARLKNDIVHKQQPVDKRGGRGGRGAAVARGARAKPP